MFWALLRAHLNPCLMAGTKMSLNNARDIFMPPGILTLLFYYIYQGAVAF